MSKKGGGSSKDWRSFLNLFAFVAIALIGICLLLGKLEIGGGIISALALIGNVIAYVIVAIGGWFYIANRKNVWLWVIYFVSIVLIVISYII